MARSRFIRPEYFTDEKVGALSYGARILYPGIWCHSDLRGVFEYSAKQLRVLVFPFDEGLTSETVQGWLTELEAHGMIVRFESDGKIWGCVPSWLKHQTFTTSEEKIGSKRPRPPPVIHESDLSQRRVSSPAPALTPAPTPSPGCARAEAPAAAAALTSKVPGIKPRSVDMAIASKDYLNVLRAFRCNLAGDRPAEWQREADGLQLGTLAAILLWRDWQHDAIREPSGLRKARALWKGLNPADRAELCGVLTDFMGRKDTA